MLLAFWGGGFAFYPIREKKNPVTVGITGFSLFLNAFRLFPRFKKLKNFALF